MIEVLGDPTSNEFKAATDLKDRILALWPEITTNDKHQIAIICGIKCHKKNTKDIDILVMGSFPQPLSYKQFIPFNAGQSRVAGIHTFNTNSFCIVIEVKDHPPQSVKFTGPVGAETVEVHYHKTGWHNVTEQNHNQIFSMRSVFEDNKLTTPWISGLIWLRGVESAEIPLETNVLGNDSPWELFLNKLAIDKQPEQSSQNMWSLSAYNSPNGRIDMDAAITAFTKTLEPTNMDRKKLEIITGKEMSSDIEQIREEMKDKELILLQGRPGAGKTIALLRLGYRLADIEKARVLILTYNQALAADIRRMISLAGLQDDVSERCLEIQTVHQLLYGLMEDIGIDVQNDFLQNYDLHKLECLELLEAADEEDMQRLREKHLSYDYIFIDEGQDWPQSELDLLTKVRPRGGIVVADGVNQLVRQQEPANWSKTVHSSAIYRLEMERCLRMKANLATFASTVAGELSVNLGWNTNNVLPGGRVLVIDRPYLDDSTLHDSLIELTKEAGQQPIDMLFCVPPSLVKRSPEQEPIGSIAAEKFAEWGYGTWDGVVPEVRRDYPLQFGQLRTVQYDSCRGLEGWVSVNLAIDDFHQYKVNDYLNRLRDTGVLTNPDDVASDEHLERANNFAARWIVIALTRAIDTLVVEIGPEDTLMRRILYTAYEKHPDFVTWMHM